MLDNNILSENELSRYRDQMALPNFSIEGQKKLKKAKVAVIGSGGLGSPVLFYLASMGVGNIKIIDFDNVSLTNLHRQILHSTKTIGKPKVLSAYDRLKSINNSINIEPICQKINQENAIELTKDVDVIVDCCDNFETRYILNNAAIENKKELCSGSVFQFSGQVAIFSPENESPCYQCLFPNEKSSSMIPNNNVVGVFPPMIGIVGCMQAGLVIKSLLKTNDFNYGELIVFDNQNFLMKKLKFKRLKTCKACGGK